MVRRTVLRSCITMWLFSDRDLNGENLHKGSCFFWCIRLPVFKVGSEVVLCIKPIYMYQIGFAIAIFETGINPLQKAKLWWTSLHLSRRIIPVWEPEHQQLASAIISIIIPLCSDVAEAHVIKKRKVEDSGYGSLTLLGNVVLIVEEQSLYVNKEVSSEPG